MEGIQKIFLTILLAVLSSALLSAQDTVTGTVVSGSDGMPVIGAAVMEVGNTTNGTVTDIDGKFSISVPEGAELIFVSIGFKDRRR